MNIMETHDFMPHLYLGAGILDGLSYVTAVQEYRCSRCGETISLPLCNKKGCQVLMSLGCSRTVKRVPWKAPIKAREIDKSEIEKRDYPAKRAGNTAKKRVKGVRS